LDGLDLRGDYRFVFASAYAFGIMAPSKERVYMDESYAKYDVLPAAYPSFNSLVYSLDVLLPIVDLHQESYWLPSTRRVGQTGGPNPFIPPMGAYFVKVWFWIQIGLGWLLTSFLVAGVTGLIKRD
jgi:hypothetical protein